MVLEHGQAHASQWAAITLDGAWLVDCTDEVSQNLEDWFAMAAIVESATPEPRSLL